MNKKKQQTIPICERRSFPTGLKSGSLVRIGQDEQERAKMILHLPLRIVPSRRDLKIVGYDALQPVSARLKCLSSSSLAKTLFKPYQSIGNAGIPAVFSRTNLRESAIKSNDAAIFPFVLLNFESLLLSAKEIEIHENYRKKDANLRCVHELISLLEVHGDVYLVRITVKERANPKENSLYVVADKEKVGSTTGAGTAQCQLSVTPRSANFIYTIADLAKAVNGDSLRWYR